MTIKLKQKPKRTATNIEMLSHLMQFSKTGPMCQMFVIDALTKHSERVANLTDDEVREHFPENGMINGFAWREAARELSQRIRDHHAGLIMVDAEEDEGY
jgi:hypothetical protein